MTIIAKTKSGLKFDINIPPIYKDIPGDTVAREVYDAVVKLINQSSIKTSDNTNLLEENKKLKKKNEELELAIKKLTQSYQDNKKQAKYSSREKNATTEYTQQK